MSKFFTLLLVTSSMAFSISAVDAQTQEAIKQSSEYTGQALTKVLVPQACMDLAAKMSGYTGEQKMDLTSFDALDDKLDHNPASLVTFGTQVAQNAKDFAFGQACQAQQELSNMSYFPRYCAQRLAVSALDSGKSAVTWGSQFIPEHSNVNEPYGQPDDLSQVDSDIVPSWISNVSQAISSKVVAGLAAASIVGAGYDCQFGGDNSLAIGHEADVAVTAAPEVKNNTSFESYKIVGTYLIAASAAVLTVVLVARHAGWFGHHSLTISEQVEALIERAQTDPNIIIVELPKILNACDNDQVRFEIFTLVLSNVEVTEEIQAAFDL